MKKTKLISAVISAAAAFAMLTAPAGAYMHIAENPEKYVTSNQSTWKFILNADENSPFNNISKMEAVVAIEGDTEKYWSDVEEGIAAAASGEATEETFTGFTGCIALSARIYGDSVTNDWWVQYNFLSLNDPDSEENDATVTQLDTNVFLISAVLDGITVDGAAGNPGVNLMEWSGKTEDYTLAVKEVYVYGADGSVVLYTDENGTYDPDVIKTFEESEYYKAPAPAETTAAETTTTAAETTAAEVTTTAADTGAAETTTTAAAVQTQSPASNADLGSRDSSLIIVGIAAGVVIVAVIVALVIVMTKKKN